MSARQAIPRLWLLTDERQGAALWPALARLPAGSGVIFRHHALAPAARRALYERVRRIARRRRLVLVLAGPPRLAIAWRADGAHGRSPHRSVARGLLRTAPAHDPIELAAAKRSGAAAVLVSPLFATRTHPGGRMLGRVRFGLIAQAARVPVIALGGMNAARWRGLSGLNGYGWAAIDAWGVRT